MLKIHIITIGNEILQGKTANTNLAFIGNELFRIGLQITSSTTIQDDPEKILRVLSSAKQEFDIVITTGGLGPTRDDMTKKCFAKFFQTQLKFNEKVWDDIKKIYNNEDKEIPQIVKTQAQVPVGCKTIRNLIGTAPGMHFESQGTHFFALPGVPKEMKRMVGKYILPFIQANYSLENLYIKTIHTFGIREAKLSEMLESIQTTSGVNIAFLPKHYGVDVRVYGYKKREFEFTLGNIREKIGNFIYGYDDDTLAKVCHKKLIRSGKTLSVAESCTGGLVGNLFTDNSGSSLYFAGGVISYSNRIKNKVLGVRSKTLDEFGAVSAQTVTEMLEGAKIKFKTDLSIAISGIAGPTGGTENKPIGLVYIGVNIDNKITVRKFNFSGTRIQIKEKSALNAINMLRNKI